MNITMKLATAVVALTIAFTSPAAAGFKTGNDLFEVCTDTGMKNLVCLGYISGIADVMSNGNSVNGYKACIPYHTVTIGQVTDIAQAFLNSAPEKRHKGAGGLVAHALEKAFPCSP
jgi:hypothetical protein